VPGLVSAGARSFARTASERNNRLRGSLSPGAYAVPNLHFPFPGGADFQGGGSSCTAEDLIARAQHLIDVPEPYDGYPLPWHVEASNVGDLTVIAAAALREHRGSDLSPG
jgi:hypothetical protein